MSVQPVSGGGQQSSSASLQQQVEQFGEALLQGAISGLQQVHGNFQNIIKTGEKTMKEEAAKNNG